MNYFTREDGIKDMQLEAKLMSVLFINMGLNMLYYYHHWLRNYCSNFPQRDSQREYRVNHEGIQYLQGAHFTSKIIEKI